MLHSFYCASEIQVLSTSTPKDAFQSPRSANLHYKFIQVSLQQVPSKSPTSSVEWLHKNLINSQTATPVCFVIKFPSPERKDTCLCTCTKSLDCRQSSIPYLTSILLVLLSLVLGALVFLFKNYTVTWKQASKERNPQRQEAYYDPLFMTGRKIVLLY